jgi:DNA sulfur modification protein DndD
MIIKEVTLINYQCYYDRKTFELTKGANIILGRNGGGKTKFFEALEWFFDNSKKQNEELISKKRLFESKPNKPFDIGVEIIFEAKGVDTRIKKYFTAELDNTDKLNLSQIVCEGERENSSGEREPIDGTSFINVIFPSTNRRYCFFKGEAELNIFKSPDALAILLGMYAKIRHYKPFAEKGEFFKAQADKAVDDAVKKDKKNEKQYAEIENEINRITRELRRDETRFDELQNEKQLLTDKLDNVERHLENAEAVEKIKKRLNDFEEKIKRNERLIVEDYTTKLFDDNWFLIHFEEIQKEFTAKITKLSEERRKLESDFDREQGIKIGERKARLDMLNNVVPLPMDIPSKAIMEEMLAQEICKVCNREAKKDSEAYVFMETRLKNYLASQDAVGEDEEVNPTLFPNNYTKKLVNIETTIDNNLSKIRSINQEVKDLIAFNQERKDEIRDLTIKRDKEQNEMEEILGSDIKGKDELSQAWKNSKAWRADLTKNEIELSRLENSIKQLRGDLITKKKEKDNIDRKSAQTYLINTRDILRDIETIFKETKDNKYTEFVETLQFKANEYLKTINLGSFTGYIELKRKSRNKEEGIEVVLMQEGEVFHHPNTSLQTSMHLAVLFAISDLTTKDKEESYPLIFDAPTSSFDTVKRKHFFEVLGKCNEQTILLTKDFTDDSGKDKGIYYNEEFKNIHRETAYLIRLDEPFEPENLATLNTLVTKL